MCHAVYVYKVLSLSLDWLHCPNTLLHLLIAWHRQGFRRDPNFACEGATSGSISSSTAHTAHERIPLPTGLTNHPYRPSPVLFLVASLFLCWLLQHRDNNARLWLKARFYPLLLLHPTVNTHVLSNSPPPVQSHGCRHLHCTDETAFTRCNFPGEPGAICIRD